MLPGSSRPRSFADERSSFLAMLPDLMASHEGRYVAVHQGKVAMTGSSRHEVVRRFFTRFPPGAPVYVGFVGPREIRRAPSARLGRMTRSATRL